MQHRRRGRGRRFAGGVVRPAGVATLLLSLSACGLRTDVADGVETAPDSRAASRSIVCADRGYLAASGSTAQQNAMAHWTEEYQSACPGVKIRYTPNGSGAGVAQFLRGATQLGGTDGALTPDEVARSTEVCPGGRAIDLPMVGGPIAIGYNLDGVDGLVLDAAALARIFDSEITVWNDPAIRRLNPGVKLPPTPISAVHRSDGSGTTQNFNAYLAGAAPRHWPYEEDKAWRAKGGVSAAGSDGLAAHVRTTSGAIGYFELSFAKRAEIPTVRLDTGGPEPVQVSAESASLGIAAAGVAGDGNDMTLRFDYRNQAAGAWPIVLVTYEIVCDRGNPPDSLPALKSFLTYMAGAEGQNGLRGIHYAPLPAELAAAVQQVVSSLS
ncbi:phosphate ABC transporter substrate-binding protein PstS [Streptomyces sp. TRM49041]|uniref:phosphate ABC transporter substrate-binding protein PstS n=1 Tax=Streptomyces sp. TRM49041 TaxID=2603216 RepID=UPI0011F097D3|nr:phosphate ABC transporter substrate-binding protein PstS [Streptomyces sp. TRM49041]